MSIEKALGKLRAAQMCHPNAVQALIDEAIAAIQQAEAQQPDNTACKSVRKRLEAQQPVTGEPVKGLLRDMQAIADGAIKIPAREFAMHALAEFGTHPAPSVPNGWRRASDLPPPGQPVIAWVDGVKVPIRAFWVPDFHLEPGDDFDTEWAKYSEEHDTFFCPSGWYESNHYEETNWQVEKPVLAWMPLPAIDAAMLAAAQAQKGGAQ